jgi:hypothetical protein
MLLLVFTAGCSAPCVGPLQLVIACDGLDECLGIVVDSKGVQKLFRIRGVMFDKICVESQRNMLRWKR